MSHNHTPTAPNDRAVTIGVSLILGALIATTAAAFTGWSAPWMLLAILAGALIGGGIGYWTSLQHH